MKDIEIQAFSTTDTEEDALNGHDSTTDAAKDIDALPFSTDDAEEGALNGHDFTTDAAKGIDALPFSIPDTEEGALNGHDSTTDTAKDIDAQAFSTTDTEEGARNGHDSTTDAAGSLGALPFSADKGRWGVRSPRGPDPPTDDVHAGTDTGNDFTDTGNDFADAENNFTAKPSNFSADRHSPAAVGTALAVDPPISPADVCRPLHTFTEKHPYLNPSFHEPHPLLRLHPPSFGGFGLTFRVQSIQPPFGRPFLGRFVDIRPACTVGSRPLRPRLTLCRTERGRCRLEHPDRECTTSANAVERSANAIRPAANEPEHGAQCSKNAIRPLADEPEHGTDERKITDFIDVAPARGHKIERNAPEYTADGCKRHEHAPEHPANAPERSTNAIRPPEDGHEHNAQRAKNADFIDVDPVRGHKIERNAPEHPTNAVSPLADAREHTADGRKRHDSAPEHTADTPEHPAYDLDAGQRVLRSAAHRRAVRAEREACCGALRHLAHCCVAF